MGEISIRDMRRLLARIEEELARHGELVLTRRGRPVARILPMHAPASGKRPSHADLRARMRRSQHDSAQLLRKERDAR